MKNTTTPENINDTNAVQDINLEQQITKTHSAEQNVVNNVANNVRSHAEDLLENRKEFFERLIQRKIEQYILGSDFSFFEKYKHFSEKPENKGGELANGQQQSDDTQDNILQIDKEKIGKKFEKYYPMHKQILLQKFEEQYRKLPKQDKKTVNNLMANLASQYLYILFIFSEKIRISDLQKSLNIPLSELRNRYTTVFTHINNLEKFGKEETDKLKKVYSENENSDFVNEIFLPSMYRHLYRQITTRGDATEYIGETIAGEIEAKYKQAFDKIYYIFATWAESGYQKSQTGLVNIEIVLRRLIDGMIFLKRNNIAFENFALTNAHDEEFCEKISEKFLDGNFDKYTDVFEIFLSGIFEKNPENKQKIYQRIDEELKKISEDNAKSRVPPETIEHENLKIRKVKFKEWETVKESQKYEKVFSEVIANNGKIKFADFLKLDSKKHFEEFAEYNTILNGFRKSEERDNYKKALEQQWIEIRALEGTSVEEFIKSDINNLNFVIVWWRFILKSRELNGEIKANKIFQTTEIPYGIIEQISKQLKEDGILDQNKVIFDPDGRIKNTSVKGADTLLMDLLKGIKKGFIDLKKEQILLINGEKKDIRKMRDLYLPKGIEAKRLNSEEEIHVITDYIDSGIDVCFTLLQGKKPETIEQQEYLSVLIEQNILPEGELSHGDLEKIQDFVEVLKFIKNRIKHIHKMLDIADQDTEILKKNETIKKILSSDKKSGFGPRKAFSRGFEKLVSDYAGDFNKIGDFTRLRVIVDDIPEMKNKVTEFVRSASQIKEVTHIAISDKTGEPISLPREKSGYRDVKLLLKMTSGNTVEVQFQYRDMYQVKDEGINLSAPENQVIFEKMEKENMQFSDEEMQKFLDYAHGRDMELPTKEILQGLMENPDAPIDWKKYENILKVEKISTDFTYHIARTPSLPSFAKKKFTRLERVIADSAWSKIVLRYLETHGVQVK